MTETMADPNTALRSVRQSLRLSQEELARAVRNAGQRSGEPNGATKRLIQRWEAGEVASPRGVYLRALELVTGQTAAALGFTPADEKYGIDRAAAVAEVAWTEPVPDPRAERGPLTGIWLSRYWYVSSGRGGQRFSSAHYCTIVQHGDRLQLRSLPGTAAGRLGMELAADGMVITGSWRELTSATGYYGGSTYSGAIQLLLDPTGHRMAGRWIGYGRDWEVNSDEWTLELVTADTSPGSIDEWNRPAEAE
jgi:transcriptional regulator with XRE-family HTH domain